MTSSLREKFQALRAFVETIPAEKLDMRTIAPRNGSDCGCVLFHTTESGGNLNSDGDGGLYGVLSPKDGERLFESGVFPTYPEPKGQPAKDEFLRRLSVLEEKYCGAAVEGGK
jgi:hypothetical protein